MPLLDERTRRAIVRLRKKGLKYEDIAHGLGVSRTSVSRLLTKWRIERSVKRRPPGGGNTSPLRAVEREFKALVHEFSDATAEELATLVGEKLGVETSRSSVIRSLSRLGFTLKKRSSSPRSGAGQTLSGDAR
jgi:transposase